MEALTYVWFIVRYTFVVINSDSAEDFQLVLCAEQEHALKVGASPRRLVAILSCLLIKACGHNEEGELNFLKIKSSLFDSTTFTRPLLEMLATHAIFYSLVTNNALFYVCLANFDEIL